MTKAEQLRKPKRGNKKSSLEKKLDKLWTTAVLHKCNHKCMICGKSEGLNAHHIEGRRNKRLRWEVYNTNGINIARFRVDLYDNNKKGPLSNRLTPSVDIISTSSDNSTNLNPIK